MHDPALPVPLWPMPENPWTTLSTETKYENPWIRVREDQVVTPGGKSGIYGVVEFKSIAVGVVPLNEALETWLVGQYRYPHDTYEWEIPEGGTAPDETPEETAQREMREETGLRAGRLIPITGLQISNSTTNEVAMSYLALDVTEGEAIPEDCEALQIRKVSLDEAIRMAMEGEIRDAISVCTLLKLAIWKKNGTLSEIMQNKS